MHLERKKYVNKDKEILHLLRQKPEEGFRLLFDVYHMQLCVYVVQLTDSFSLAEDIVQDTFIYVIENTKKEEVSFKYYIEYEDRKTNISYINFKKKSSFYLIFR